MFSLIRYTSLLLSISLLLACTPAPDTDAVSSPASIASSANPTAAANVKFEKLPDEIATRVKAKLSEELGETSLQVGRYSREIWSDGCLGLGGPAELCLAALTEGWQVEVIDTTGQSYFYRTNLGGDSIRRSTLAHNLPPSLRDRIFQTAVESGLARIEDLAIATAEPRLWDSCYGMPPVDGACPEIGILGWRAVVSDGTQIWVYHTDNLGAVIRRKDE